MYQNYYRNILKMKIQLKHKEIRNSDLLIVELLTVDLPL